MNLLIIGNLISLTGCLLMVGVGFIRKKDRILAVQCLQFGIMGLGNLVLGAASGFISNMVGILRNLAFAKWKTTLPLKLGFSAAQAVLSIGALQNGMIEWLPILAAALFTWFLDTKSEAKLKIVIIVTQILWLIYDLYYLNYVATTFDVLTILSNLIGIRMVLKSK